MRRRKNRRLSSAPKLYGTGRSGRNSRAAAGGHRHRCERRFYLGGTYIAHQALLAGRIDVYVEYTGTALTAVLKQPAVSDPRVAYEIVRSRYKSQFDLEIGPPLGFENTFAIVIRGKDARRLKLRTLSDAAPHAHGWRAPSTNHGASRRFRVCSAYDISRAPPRIMTLVSCIALTEEQVDLVQGTPRWSHQREDLFVLADERRTFHRTRLSP